MKKCYQDPWLKITGILGVSVEQAKNGPVRLSDFKEVVWRNLQEQEGYASETRVGMQRMT